jgi:hypothetical protein
MYTERMVLKLMLWKSEWFEQAQNLIHCENRDDSIFTLYENRKFLGQLSNCQLLKKILYCGVRYEKIVLDCLKC